MRNALILLAIALLAVGANAQESTTGTLHAVNKKGVDVGICPLKATSVKTDISGFVARVHVRQEFENTFTEPIEAVYTFPLSQNGAVDEMTMTVGTRTVRGRIMKREEAKQIYETAKNEGKSAALLDQQRPNIFTQAVANIIPGETILIELSYVETLKYEDGEYEFVFPMTVGPRYNPRTVKDAEKVRPPVTASRPGHDISIEVNLNAGVPVEAIRSTSHEIEQLNVSPENARINLKGEKLIPNKDFILRYDVSGNRIADAVLAHRDARGGFFTLVLQPPDRFNAEDITPKEIVFVLDTSGSMYGFPIEKAKEAMRLALDGLHPSDTFNLITFAGDTHVLFDEPVPATQANLEMAQAFLETREGSGGTEMMKAIKAALDPSDSRSHLRIVCFMTDGYVGNEGEIIAEIQKHPKARVFSFGIGSSVNRFLLDKMAEAGSGEVEYVSLTDDGSKAAKRFHERVRTPLLTDLSIDWNGMPVADVYPSKIGDLFSAKPVIVNGRYKGAASGTIKLKGNLAGQPYEREIAVNLPASEASNDVLATLWARKRVDELSNQALRPEKTVETNKLITTLGLEFKILTQFTSFVAVEERIVNHNGKPTRMEVPVALAEGVDPKYTLDGVDQVANVTGGGGGGIATGQVTNLPGTVSPTKLKPSRLRRALKPSLGTGTGYGSGSGSGYGSGSGSGPGSGLVGPPAAAEGDKPFARMQVIANLQRLPRISAGVLNVEALNLSTPEYPAAARAINAGGSVSVFVTIDENGNVVSAEAVSGHPLLRESAQKSAKSTTFAPTMLSGQPVKVNGLIIYNYEADSNGGNVTVTTVNVAIQTADSKPVAAEMLREWMIKQKLHSWVYALVERLRIGSNTVGPNDGRFVSNGRANLRVTTVKVTPDLKTRLASLGFEILAEKGVILTGRIAVSKLAQLGDMDEIKLILPDA